MRFSAVFKSIFLKATAELRPPPPVSNFKFFTRTLSPTLISFRLLEIFANTSTVAEPIVIISSILPSFKNKR